MASFCTATHRRQFVSQGGVQRVQCHQTDTLRTHNVAMQHWLKRVMMTKRCVNSHKGQWSGSQALES
eukprot:2943647-Amphidinium_carterae.1